MESDPNTPVLALFLPLGAGIGVAATVWLMRCWWLQQKGRFGYLPGTVAFNAWVGGPTFAAMGIILTVGAFTINAVAATVGLVFTVALGVLLVLRWRQHGYRP